MNSLGASISSVSTTKNINLELPPGGDFVKFNNEYVRLNGERITHTPSVEE